MSEHSAHPEHPHDEVHVVPLPVYFGVFGALMVGTFLTVWVAGHDWGAWNVPLALAIAVTKATLVVLFFMHVKYNTRLTQLVVAAGFAWLLLMLTGIAADYYAPHFRGQPTRPTAARD